MATAIQIITRALRTLQVLGTDESPSADQASDAFDSLNDLLSGWSDDQALFYQIVLQNFPLISGQRVYTIGPAGNFNTIRPMSIQNAYVNWSGVDYSLGLVTREQYDQISLKTTQTQIPYVLQYNSGFPQSEIKLWPIPNDPTAILYIESRQPFTSFATMTTDANMPPGYERALRYNLAVELMPEYGVNDPKIIRLAAVAKTWLKRVNYDPLILELDTALPLRGNIYDFYNGTL